MAEYKDPWIYTSDDILKSYHKLESPADLDPLLERIKDARYVLLGESTHGTHEFTHGVLRSARD